MLDCMNGQRVCNHLNESSLVGGDEDIIVLDPQRQAALLEDLLESSDKLQGQVLLPAVVSVLDNDALESPTWTMAVGRFFLDPLHFLHPSLAIHGHSIPPQLLL
jgi:hypothetical protein